VVATDGLFPLPSGDLVICAGEADGQGATTILGLIEDYARLTGQAVVFDMETRQHLEHSYVGLVQDVVVPPAAVQGFFEAILANFDFLLTIQRRAEPRLLRITSLNTGDRNMIRSSALRVDADELLRWQEHPALMVTTTVDLPNTDVRQLSNSMRTMITDANTQQLMAAGNSNSMVLTGVATQVAGQVKMLRAVDAAAEVEDEQPIFERFVLKHADAEAIAPSVQALIPANNMGPPQGQRQQQMIVVMQLQPRVMPDPRTNALVVVCLPSDLAGIKQLVALFDAEK